MTSIVVNLDGDGLKPDWDPAKILNIQEATISSLEGGMSSGLPSVSILADGPNGEQILIQTSLALYLTAADAMVARYGDPRGAGKTIDLARGDQRFARIEFTGERPEDSTVTTLNGAGRNTVVTEGDGQRWDTDAKAIARDLVRQLRAQGLLDDVVSEATGQDTN